MGLFSVALPPVRAVMGDAELLVATGRMVGRAAETLNELVEPLTRVAERIPGRRGRGNRD